MNKYFLTCLSLMHVAPHGWRIIWK